MTKKQRNKPLDTERDPELTPELDPELPPEQGVSDEEPQRLSQVAEEEEAASSLAKEIENLAIALDQKTKEAAEANEKYLRAYADFENYRKRVQRDQADFRKYANEQMALELLTVIDHLSLAIKHANEAGGGEGLQQGVEMVHKQFRDVLEKFGIVQFKAQGEPFDPSMHDAMMQVETVDVPENTVVKVFQEGYRYHEKVLRHAKVGVSKRPAEAAGEPPAAAAEEHTDADTED
jgi:molecular chaperone GrpE